MRENQGAEGQERGAIGSSSPAHGRVSPTAASELRPGWHQAEHGALPRPTYWPAVMVLGIVFLAWGIVTSFLISGVGLILFALALAGWIGELRHGH